MKHRYIGPLAVALLSLPVVASSLPTSDDNPLRFLTSTVDFGAIREEDGEVTKQVKGVNVSNDTTFIISARTSCGCSGVKYDESPIAPGDTTTVSITYDPTNRPGKFLKTVKVFTGEERIGHTVKITGNVIPSRRHLDKAYPEKVGSLRFTTIILNAGEVRRTEARPFFVGIYNDSDTPLALAAETDSPALEAAFAPDSIDAFGVATLNLMLKARNAGDNEKEFIYKAYILDASKGDTLASIPVGGIFK